MTLLSFKEDSILNNGFARGLNLVVWGVLLSICFAIEDAISFPVWGYFVVAFVTGIATSICLEKVLKNTTFFEWDYTERKKKSSFIVLYTTICSALWVFISADAFLVYKALVSNISWLFKFVPIILIVFFVFNLLNICSLFYPIFEDYLKPAYKIQKKPDNWQENGPEINDEDEVHDIMRRDFRV